MHVQYSIVPIRMNKRNSGFWPENVLNVDHIDKYPDHRWVIVTPCLTLNSLINSDPTPTIHSDVLLRDLSCIHVAHSDHSRVTCDLKSYSQIRSVLLVTVMKADLDFDTNLSLSSSSTVWCFLPLTHDIVVVLSCLVIMFWHQVLSLTSTSMSCNRFLLMIMQCKKNHIRVVDSVRRKFHDSWRVQTWSLTIMETDYFSVSMLQCIVDIKRKSSMLWKESWITVSEIRNWNSMRHT